MTDEPTSSWPRWDRRLWSRAASWLLVAVLALSVVNLWQTAAISRELRYQRARAEARHGEFAAFRTSVMTLAATADGVHVRSLAEIAEMRKDIDAVNATLRKVEAEAEAKRDHRQRRDK